MRVDRALVGTRVLVVGCGARWNDEQQRRRCEPASNRTEVWSAAGRAASAGDGPAGSQSAGAARRRRARRPAPHHGTPAGGRPATGAAGRTRQRRGRGRRRRGRCRARRRPTRTASPTPRSPSGEISSLSGPVPGLGDSAAAAVRGLRRRTATRRGGVCGRELVLQGGRRRNRRRPLPGGAQRARSPRCSGSPAASPSATSAARTSSTSSRSRSSTHRPGGPASCPWSFDINPDFPQPDMLIGKYRYLYEQGARKVSMTYIAVDQSRIEANIQRGPHGGRRARDRPRQRAAAVDAQLRRRRPCRRQQRRQLPLVHRRHERRRRRWPDRCRDTGHEWLFKEFSYTTYGTNFIELAGRRRRGRHVMDPVAADRGGVDERGDGHVRRVDEHRRRPASPRTSSRSTPGCRRRRSSRRSRRCPGRSPGRR